jgi:hypothetical protein
MAVIGPSPVLSALIRRKRSLAKKLEQDLSTIDGGHIPAGYKPFKVPFDSPSWEVESPLAGKTLTIQFPDTCTNAEAKERVHLVVTGWNVEIDLAMSQNRKEGLVKETSAEMLVSEGESKLASLASRSTPKTSGHHLG